MGAPDRHRSRDHSSVPLNRAASIDFWTAPEAPGRVCATKDVRDKKSRRGLRGPIRGDGQPGKRTLAGRQPCAERGALYAKTGAYASCRRGRVSRGSLRPSADKCAATGARLAGRGLEACPPGPRLRRRGGARRPEPAAIGHDCGGRRAEAARSPEPRPQRPAPACVLPAPRVGATRVATATTQPLRRFHRSRAVAVAARAAPTVGQGPFPAVAAKAQRRKPPRNARCGPNRRRHSFLRLSSGTRSISLL